LARPDSPAGPPYLRIAAELRRRIEESELGPGDPLPSTRQIVREFGVAMATASKALTALQNVGLARSVRGIGTVVGVVDPPSPASPRRRRGTTPLSRGMIVAAALQIADGEGLSALSMRRIAAHLDVTTMALYRHVSNREHLILLMAHAAFTQFPLPEPPPAGWRRQLETAARLQWTLYQRHPWLAQATSFTRPLLAPRALAHTEWVMRALDGLGLDPVTAVHVHATTAAYVRGLAVNLEPEAEAAANSGISDREWMDGPGARALASDAVGQAFPHLARVPANSLDLGTLFEFGLQRLLDGIAMLISASE
jgi:DNA-binding transcriptional regulator YhcF (GntR family)